MKGAGISANKGVKGRGQRIEMLMLMYKKTVQIDNKSNTHGRKRLKKH